MEMLEDPVVCAGRFRRGGVGSDNVSVGGGQNWSGSQPVCA